MILLIKLSKVIALHATRALASAISAINGVDVTFSLPVCNSRSHTHTAGFSVSTL